MRQVGACLPACLFSAVCSGQQESACLLPAVAHLLFAIYHHQQQQQVVVPGSTQGRAGCSVVLGQVVAQALTHILNLVGRSVGGITGVGQRRVGGKGVGGIEGNEGVRVGPLCTLSNILEAACVGSITGGLRGQRGSKPLFLLEHGFVEWVAVREVLDTDWGPGNDVLRDPGPLHGTLTPKTYVPPHSTPPSVPPAPPHTHTLIAAHLTASLAPSTAPLVRSFTDSAVS